MAVAEDSSRRAYWDGRGAIWLWAAMFAAPLAWTLDQGLSYPSVKPSCAGGSEAPLLIYPVVAMAIVIAGTWIGWSCLASVRDAADDGGRVIDRSYFMAVVAIGFNVLIGVLIVTATIPVFLLSPCE
jgi:hypothetical protein